MRKFTIELSNKINIAFIADGSINNPILFSQGIPLLKNNIKKGYKSFLITFELKDSDKKSIELKLKSVSDSLVQTMPIFLTEVKYVPGWLFYFSEGLIKLYFYIRKNNINILHARSFFPSIISHIIKLFSFGKISVIYDTRGVFIEEEIYKGHWKVNSIKTKFFKLIDKYLLQNSDHIVVVSNKHKDYIHKLYPKISLDKRISIINNKLQINSDFKYENKVQNKIIGIYSGSAAAWQKIDEVINLIKISSEYFNNINYKILTYDPAPFNNLFVGYKGENYMIETTSHDNVFNVLSNCSFGILMRENMIVNQVSSPLKFAEYLHAGLPVLMSEGVGDCEEIILKYNVGVIIRNNNLINSIESMIEVLKDSTIHMRCHEVAKKEFNINDAFDSYNMIYKQCFNKINKSNE